MATGLKSTSQSSYCHTDNQNFKQDCNSANEIIGQYRNECASSPEMQKSSNILRKGRFFETLTAAPFQSSESRSNLCITGRCQQNRRKNRAQCPSSDVDAESFTKDKDFMSIEPFAATNRAQARSTLSYERLISRCSPSVGVFMTSSTWSFIDIALTSSLCSYIALCPSFQNLII
jgi:hypothetical protein